ncbi:MAG: tetratricopeptide repeat protein [Comamonadaceae bacterium]|nr:tetratricopeptide repeat protein [Comamonadaceae bacterium]
MTQTLPSQDGPAALVNSAFAANRGGAFEAAEKLCRRALRVAPALPEAHFNLGRALRGLGRGVEAREALRRAAALTPNSAPAQNEIGLELKVWANGAWPRSVSAVP